MHPVLPKYTDWANLLKSNSWKSCRQKIRCLKSTWALPTFILHHDMCGGADRFLLQFSMVWNRSSATEWGHVKVINTWGGQESSPSPWTGVVVVLCFSNLHKWLTTWIIYSFLLHIIAGHANFKPSIHESAEEGRDDVTGNADRSIKAWQPGVHNRCSVKVKVCNIWANYFPCHSW